MYWCSAFQLPTIVVSKLNSMLSGFILSSGQNKGIPKISWFKVTRPLCLGGLGLRDIKVINFALTMQHLRHITINKMSL